jgi:hypothetical protein
MPKDQELQLIERTDACIGFVERQVGVRGMQPDGVEFNREPGMQRIVLLEVSELVANVFGKLNRLGS